MTMRPHALRLANLVVFQIAWFAAVLGAAHGMPLWGTVCVLGAIAWHLGVAKEPAKEALLVGIVCVLGFALESIHAAHGLVRYPSGQPVAQLAPYWMVALWGLLAIALNVTLRWLRGHWWLAGVLGATAGPASFASGVALGGAQFVDRTPALAALALSWACALPVLVWLSIRFDGFVTGPQVRHAN
jgi:hypothetical protein